MFSRVIVKLLGGVWSVKAKGRSSKFYRIIYNYYQFEHGSAISIDAAFENEPLFPRGMKQIVIGNGVKVGKNCVIYQQVTIDGALLPNDITKGTPEIGDNCYIYPGAKIIGDVNIGDNVIVFPNAVVTEDVPSNTNV